MRRARGGWVGAHERAATLRLRALSYRLADGAAPNARGGRLGAAPSRRTATPSAIDVWDQIKKKKATHSAPSSTSSQGTTPTRTTPRHNVHPRRTATPSAIVGLSIRIKMPTDGAPPTAFDGYLKVAGPEGKGRRRTEDDEDGDGPAGPGRRDQGGRTQGGTAEQSTRVTADGRERQRRGNGATATDGDDTDQRRQTEKGGPATMK